MERRTLDSCGKERENGDPAAQRGSSGSSPRKASDRSAMERTC
ncbi:MULTISPECIES: hypothetical protein [Priestia]|nr:MULTISPECIES: hypothetical protein [Priestia]